MFSKILKRCGVVVLAGLLSYPLVSFAQNSLPQNPVRSNSDVKTFGDIVNVLLGYINLLIPLLFGLTFLVLAWGVVSAWIVNAGNSEKVEEGKMIALWGVIGLVVMLGVWALVAILRNSLFGTI